MPHSFSSVKIVRTPHQPQSIQGPDAAPQWWQRRWAGASSSDFSVFAYQPQSCLSCRSQQNNYSQSQIHSLVLMQLLNCFLYSSSSNCADKEITVINNQVNIAELLSLFLSSPKTCRKVILLLKTLSKEKSDTSPCFSLLFHSCTKKQIFIFLWSQHSTAALLYSHFSRVRDKKQ